MSTNPPPGTDADQDRGPDVLIATWILVGGALLFLGLRVLGKVWTGRSLWLDDYVLMVAWLTVFVASVLTALAVQAGLGKHEWNVPPQSAKTMSFLTLIIITILVVGSMLSKTSFAITILRLVSGWMVPATWFVLVTTNMFLAMNIVLVWVNFHATSENQDKSAAAQRLQIALADYAIFATAYSAVMDFALVAMAWTIVASLRLRTLRERVGVAIALSMGVLAGAASIAKTAVLPTVKGGDTSYAAASVHVWSVAEPTITVAAASIPMLRILFGRVVQATRGGSSRHTGRRGGGGGGGGSKGAGPGWTASTKRTVASARAGGEGGPYDVSATTTAARGVGVNGSDEDVLLKDLAPISRFENWDARDSDIYRE